MSKISLNFRNPFLRVATVGGFLLFWVLAILVASPVLAQRGEPSWDEPINLSQSGTANAPNFFVDNEGVTHVFWVDSIDGTLYQSGELNNLSDPQVLRVPFSFPRFELPSEQDLGEEFTVYQPQFSTTDEEIHAYWIDGDGAIRYSRTTTGTIGLSFEGWSETFFLVTDSVVNMESGIDENGRFHLFYLQTSTTELLMPGIYHQFSDDAGRVWSDPNLIYGSTYFRDIEPDSTQMSVDYAGSSVFLTWDDRTIEQLLFVNSTNGGETWQSPQIIEQREATDPPASLSSSNLSVLAVDENELHLIWLNGDTDDFLRCNVNHQWSDDGGRNWSTADHIFDSGGGSCPAQPRLVLAETGLILAMNIDDGVGYLQAFDGERWSDPNPQLYLGTLQDPLTFRDVGIGCHQFYVSTENELVVLGCGDGNERDIWLLTRPLGELSDWFRLFEATPVWSEPVSLISSQIYLLPGEVVAGADGRIHTFWSQSDDVVAIRRLEEVTTEVGPDIYYARLNGGQWGAPRPILSSPIGKADQLAAAADESGRLFVAWSSGKDGGIYMSRSNADRASSATEWVDPILLPAPQTTGSWPDILVDGTTIYVAYTIPLNEDRGIYLTKSTDGGNNWSDPALVFDGELEEWQQVGRPRLARTLDGQLHITWTRDVPTSNSTLALVYANSDDDGQTWTAPEVITEETVVWSDIVGIGTRTVHRAWQALSDNRVLLWHQVSFDNGRTWGQPVRVSNPAMDSGPAVLVLGVNQTPHLLQLAQTVEAELFLLEWFWDGADWVPSEELELSETMIGADNLAAVRLSDNQLGVLYGTLILDPETTDIEDNIIYTSRVLDETAVEATPLPTLTPTAPPTATPTVEPTIAPTATVDLNPTPGAGGGNNNQGNSPNGILVGVLPAVAIVSVVFVFGFWWTRRS
ncbi:MAG: exo-alpha-sialidase [Chloroflexota bacterium]